MHFIYFRGLLLNEIKNKPTKKNAAQTFKVYEDKRKDCKI